MSISQNVGTLTVQPAGTFYFASVLSPDGGIPDEPIQTEELLEDRGVDYTRWRDDSMKFIDFQLTTVEDYISDAAGVALRRRYFQAASGFGTLTIIRGGQSYRYAKVKIAAVQPAIRPGALEGFGASVGSAGTILATWRMRLTQRPS